MTGRKRITVAVFCAENRDGSCTMMQSTITNAPGYVHSIAAGVEVGGLTCFVGYTESGESVRAIPKGKVEEIKFGYAEIE